MITKFLQVFFFTLPFQFALSPLEGVDLHISRLFAIFIFFAWLFGSLLQKRFLFPTNFPSFLLLSVLFLATISFLWAEEPIWSLRKAAFLLSFFPLLFVLQAFFLEEGMRGARKLFFALVFGSVLVSMVAILGSIAQFFFGVEMVFSLLVGHILPIFLGNTFAASVAEYPSLLVNINGVTVLRATGFFPDPHIFAYFMGMTIPFAYALSATMESSSKKLFFFSVATLILVADLLSFSRGGYVGLLFGLVITIFVLKKEILASSRMKATLFAGGIILLVVLFFPSPLHDRFLSSFSLEEGSNSGRIALWKEGIWFLFKQPIFGYGLGNYPLQVKPSTDYREPIYAHNLFLDVSLDFGLFGGFLFFLALLGGIYALSHKRNVFSRAAAISLSIFFAHSFFETPLYSVHILPLFLLVFSVISLKKE